jgi:hypothetical protein
VECPECKAPLQIADSKLQSDVGSTDVYSVLTMVCVNPKGSNYCGPNLNQPLKIAETVRNKVN